MQSGYETLPQIESKNRTVPGWSVAIKHVRKQSLFWHWIWSEAGRPTRGTLYEVMKRARHKYHYAVRRLRKNKLQLQRDRISDQMYDNDLFWSNICNVNPKISSIPTTMDGKQSQLEIASVFYA